MAKINKKIKQTQDVVVMATAWIENSLKISQKLTASCCHGDHFLSNLIQNRLKINWIRKPAKMSKSWRFLLVQLQIAKLRPHLSAGYCLLLADVLICPQKVVGGRHHLFYSPSIDLIEKYSKFSNFFSLNDADFSRYPRWFFFLLVNFRSNRQRCGGEAGVGGA